MQLRSIQVSGSDQSEFPVNVRGSTGVTIGMFEVQVARQRIVDQIVDMIVVLHLVKASVFLSQSTSNYWCIADAFLACTGTALAAGTVRR